jgi:hypothetical protein
MSAEKIAWKAFELIVLPAIPGLGKLLAGALETPASLGNPVAKRVIDILPVHSESEEAAEEIRQLEAEGGG